jgi:hypothetical protein
MRARRVSRPDSFVGVRCRLWSSVGRSVGRGFVGAQGE